MVKDITSEKNGGDGSLPEINEQEGSVPMATENSPFAE